MYCGCSVFPRVPSFEEPWVRRLDIAWDGAGPQKHQHWDACSGSGAGIKARRTRHMRKGDVEGKKKREKKTLIITT